MEFRVVNLPYQHKSKSDIHIKKKDIISLVRFKKKKIASQLVAIRLYIVIEASDLPRAHISFSISSSLDAKHFSRNLINSIKSSCLHLFET